MPQRPQPFVGHEGVWCRIRINESDGLIIIKEGPLGQILRILLCIFVCVPTGSFAIWAEWTKQYRHPNIIVFCSILCCVISFVFCLRYSYSYLGRHRIEIATEPREILLFKAGSRPSQRYRLDELETIEIVLSLFEAAKTRRMIENFTLRLILKDESRSIDLCTSERKETIEDLKNRIDALRVGKHS